MYRTGMLAYVFLILTAAVAFGGGRGKDYTKGGSTTTVPEIDPTSAVSAVALVSGILLVFKNRRK